MKIKIRVVIRKYRKDSGAGLEGEILRNDVLEVDYGMDYADEYQRRIFHSFRAIRNMIQCCLDFFVKDGAKHSCRASI